MKQLLAWVLVFALVIIFVRIAVLVQPALVYAPSSLGVVATPPPETATPTLARSLIETPVAPNPESEVTRYAVVRVVDGDTVDIVYEGKQTRLRLIGINTPETVDPRRTVECFGKEASAQAAQLLTGKDVRLEFDLSQGRFDKYDRMLAYVFTPDGVFVNQSLIEEGFAYEYTYRTAYRYQAEFKASEHAARTNARGLWAPGVCQPSQIRR